MQGWKFNEKKVQAAFAEKDANGDGVLSRKEIEASQTKK